MNITQYIPASLILGSVLAASASPVWAEGQGVGSVELIPFPEGSTSFVNAYFSGDGQLRLLHDLGGLDSYIYQYADGEWAVIRRELRAVVPGLTPFDVSADGSRVMLSDFNSRVEVLDGLLVTTMPREWTYRENHQGHSHTRYARGDVSAGKMSGDGRVVTLVGLERDVSSADSLVWFGGEELVNLSADLPRDGMYYGTGMPNDDGSVIVFGWNMGSAPSSTSEQGIWRWQEGELSEINLIDTFEEFRIELIDISADGGRVFGNVVGPARGGISHTELDEASPWAQPHFGQSIAWIWSEDSGTEELIDRSRFLETSIRSVDAEGSSALIWARPRGSRYLEQYLWLGGNKFIELDELFHSLNISIDADFYGFNEISDDGTKLMGLASVDGQIYSHAIIVTIPDLTP